MEAPDLKPKPVLNRHLPQPLHRMACGAIGAATMLAIGSAGWRYFPPGSWLYTAATVLVWLSVPVWIALACVAHRFSIVEGCAGDVGYEHFDTEHEDRAEHCLGRWLRFPVWAFLFGTVLFLFGSWCLQSSDTPAPRLALPLPPRFLTGLGFLLWNPFSLVPITLILTASRLLMSKLSRASSAAVALVGLAVLLVGALWVPNPIALWPFSTLGEHTLPELIGQLFTFHIVPSPQVSYDSAEGFQALIRWQLMECGARFCVLVIGWTTCLAAIRRIDAGHKTNSLPAAQRQ